MESRLGSLFAGLFLIGESLPAEFPFVSHPAKWLPTVLLALVALAAGLCVGRLTASPRESPRAVPAGLSERLFIDYPMEGFPSRRKVSLRVDRVTDSSGAVVFGRAWPVDKHPPTWKLKANGHTYYAVPESD